MRIAIALLAATAAVATPLVAHQQQSGGTPGSKNRAAITGGTYTSDANHTIVKWEVDHLGFTPLWGMFGQVTGNLTLDPRNPAAARVDVTIPVSRVVTAVPSFTKHLLRPGRDGGRPDMFGANPADARFVSTRVEVTDDDEARLHGNLTLNGVTRPVTLEVDFFGAGRAPQPMGGRETVGFEAEGSIRRSEFNLGYAIPMVPDEVKLKIAAAFEK